MGYAWRAPHFEDPVSEPSSEPIAADVLLRATRRLADIPVDLRGLLADCCEALGVDGASLIAGKDLDATELSSVGRAEGTPSSHVLPTAVWTVLHVYGRPVSAEEMLPWMGILAGALARRNEGGGHSGQRLFYAGTLMRMMAHDLRNLLGVFDQNLLFVRQELEELAIPKDATAFEDIGQVHEASAHVLRYVQRVHELAHILQGPWPSAPAGQRFELGLLSRDGVHEGGQQIRVQIESDLPEIRMDEHRIELIAEELIQNSVRAGAKRIQVAVSKALHGDPLVLDWKRSLSQGPFVYWTIEDDGEGMDVFVLARCGEPMFSHPPGNERPGLGFSLIQAIMGAIGGQIAVTSVRGQGSRVILAIPAAHHPAPAGNGRIAVLVPESVRLKVAVRLSSEVFAAWVKETLVESQFVLVDAISDAAVLVADRDGAAQFLGPPTSLLYVGKGWPAGMARPDAVMAPQPDRDGFIRRLSMAVARRSRRNG
ncbi:MAG: hypothetical protein CL927_04660 [Deltaproteobacteria bacterium]|nr:hypothetical protein [Deltaproteobacteria bacterium]